MPIAFLTGLSKPANSKYGPFSWLNRVGSGVEGDGPCIDLKKLVYIGLRDVEPEEQTLLDQHGIKYFTSEDVKR